MRTYKNGSYHIDVYLPKILLLKSKKILYKSKYIKISNHLKDELNKNNSHKLNINCLLAIIGKIRKDYVYPFEVEVHNNKVVKAVWRFRYNDNKDISIAMCINRFYKCTFVKTAWINSNTDSHFTLNVNKYVNKYNKVCNENTIVSNTINTL